MTGQLATSAPSERDPADASPPTRSVVGRALWISRWVLPSLVLLGAVSTLIGWVTDTTGGVIVGDAGAPMRFNTALGFVLVSVGLILNAARRGGAVVRGLAVLVALLGFVTLVQYVFRTTFGIDELFFEHTITSHTPFPGRMSSSTALAFILTGSALAVRASIRNALGWGTLLILGLVFVDRFLGPDALDATPLSTMAPQTQLMFALIGLALVVGSISIDGQGHLNTATVPAYIGTACLLVLLMASWKFLERNQWEQREDEVEVAVEALASDLEAQVREQGEALSRMADRWTLYGAPEQQQWEREARQLLADFPRFDVMLIVEPDFTVRWHVPRDLSRPSLVGTNLGTDQGRLETFTAALDDREPRLMPFLDLRSGQRGTAYTVPLFDDDRHIGYLNASVTADDVLTDSTGPYFSGFDVALLDPSGLTVGELPASDSLGSVLIEQRPVEAFGRNWQLSVWPTDGYIQQRFNHLPLGVLVFELFALGLFLAYQRQVVRREHALEEARRSDERFQFLAHATSDVIWDWDVASDAIWWGPGIGTDFSYAPGDVGAGSDWRLDRIHPDDREVVETSLRDAIDGDTIEWNAQYRMADANGDYRHVSDTAFVIRDENGAASRVVGGIVDTTEQRQVAQRLQESQKMDALGQLTGGIAHDFNNLLTVILGNSELLSDELGDSDDLRALADGTAAAAKRGAELTGRLLAFARRQPLEPTRVDINELLSGMQDLIRRTVEEHIDIRLLLDDTPCSVEVDEGQLESAILNLVLNARDAMARGGHLTIETAMVVLDSTYAEFEHEGEAGVYALISVSDTGSGMSEDVLHQAFDPFFTTKPEGRGTGLGLSMVLGFIKQSGGHLRVYSEPGEGTTVKIYLPAAPNDPAPEVSTMAITSSSGGREHILLVEDDEPVLRMVESILLRLGYRVSTAMSGAEALEILDHHTDVDLLFTDVIMPGDVSGPELAEQAVATRPDLKVLFTSGYTGQFLIHGGRLDDHVHLLSKPYSHGMLAAKLRAVLTESDPVGT